RLPDEIKENNAHVNWFRIRGLRNRIVHNYSGIDYKIIWDTKEDYLEELIIEITKILNNY
ncbi:MAG: DUF86 domain-containing protein, partial [Bacteroidetes bacterium]|nr:DUF86 domain-containing protein [Bacteroidota bacterium]